MDPREGTDSEPKEDYAPSRDSGTTPYADPRNPYNDPTLPYYNPDLGKKKDDSSEPKEDYAPESSDNLKKKWILEQIVRAIDSHRDEIRSKQELYYKLMDEALKMFVQVRNGAVAVIGFTITLTIGLVSINVLPSGIAFTVLVVAALLALFVYFGVNIITRKAVNKLSRVWLQYNFTLLKMYRLKGAVITSSYFYEINTIEDCVAMSELPAAVYGASLKALADAYSVASEYFFLLWIEDQLKNESKIASGGFDWLYNEHYVKVREFLHKFKDSSNPVFGAQDIWVYLQDYEVKYKTESNLNNPPDLEKKNS